MLKVSAVCFHTAMQTFSPLINSVVDNGLLHTGPCINQMCMQYMNEQVSKLTKERTNHSSCDINETSNYSTKQILKIAIVSFFHILSAIFLPNIN